VLCCFGLSLSECETLSSFSLLQNVEGDDLGPENHWWKNCCSCDSQLLVHFWQPCFVLKSPSMIWSSSDGSKVFGDVIILGRCDNVPTHKGTTSQHGDVGLTTVAAQLSWKKVLESWKEACQRCLAQSIYSSAECPRSHAIHLKCASEISSCRSLEVSRRRSTVC
jgi:hypothetical protein